MLNGLKRDEMFEDITIIIGMFGVYMFFYSIFSGNNSELDISTTESKSEEYWPEYKEPLWEKIMTKLFHMYALYEDKREQRQEKYIKEHCDMNLPPAFTYEEAERMNVQDLLNTGKYEVLRDVIVPMTKTSINTFGLSFIEDLNKGVLKKRKFLSLLRELTQTDSDKKRCLYIRHEREKRQFDNSSYDYVDYYYYVFLTDENKFIEVFSGSKYSMTMEYS